MRLRYRRLVFFSLILALIFSLPTSSLADGDMAIKNWQIDSRLLEDGSLEIEETLVFYFNASFNEFTREIDLGSSQGLEDLLIEEVSDQPIEYRLANKDQLGEDGYYSLEKLEDRISLRIFKEAEYEEKAFRFSYRLPASVHRYRDVSDFSHSFVSKNNNFHIENLSLSLKLPGRLDQALEIYSHGDRSGQLLEKEDQLDYKTSQLKKGDFFELRLLMPEDYFKDLAKETDQDMLEIIRKQEKSYSLKNTGGTIKSRRESSIELISLGLIGLAGVFLIYSYIKSKISKRAYEKELEGQMIYLAPAIITALARMPFDSNMLVTSIYHLVNKGVLGIEDAGTYDTSSKSGLVNFKLTLDKKDKSKLNQHEVFLLDWLFKDMAQGESIKTQDIYIYQKKNPTEFHKKFTDWCRLVSKDLINLKLKDNSQVGLGIFTIILSLVLLIFSIFNIIIYRNLLRGLILLVLFFLLLIAGIEATQRLTALGQLEYGKLMKFKKDLLEARINIRDEKLLILAAALGVDMKKLLVFEDNFLKDGSSTSNWTYWFFLRDKEGRSLVSKSIEEATGLSNISLESFDK